MSRIIGRIPSKFTDSNLRMLFAETQRVFDNLNGAWLRDGSVTWQKLSLNARSIPIGTINFPEWHIPLSLPEIDRTTTSTTFLRCSGIFPWDSARYPITGGAWHFESYIAISDAAQTVSARLFGTAEVANSLVTHTGNALLTVRRSPALTMPTGAVNLTCEFRSSVGTATATFAGARLIFVPS